jgi:hypothetical protein
MPLLFLQENHLQLPILAQLACDYLLVSAPMCACKWTFLAAADICPPSQGGMLPKTIEQPVGSQALLKVGIRWGFCRSSNMRWSIYWQCNKKGEEKMTVNDNSHVSFFSTYKVRVFVISFFNSLRAPTIVRVIYRRFSVPQCEIWSCVFYQSW